jgi:hypothetical protein
MIDVHMKESCERFWGLTGVLLKIHFFWYVTLVAGYLVPEVSKIAIPSSSGSSSPRSVTWMDCPCKSGAYSPSNRGEILTHQQGVTFQGKNFR